MYNNKGVLAILDQKNFVKFKKQYEIYNFYNIDTNQHKSFFPK